MELNHFQEAFSLKAIDIYYLDNFSYGDEDKKRANEGYYRINLETLNKDVLVPGETKVNIPTSIIVSESLDENTYNIHFTWFVFIENKPCKLIAQYRH